MDDQRLGKLEGLVSGHANRIETCEKDRDDLFSSRNDHENRLTKIETYRKAEASYDGKERRGKSITFNWIINIITVLIALGCLILMVSNNKAVGAENCPYVTDDKSATIKELIKVINADPTTIELGFRFDCKNPKDESPILNMYTLRTRKECIAKIGPLEFLSDAISTTWDRVIGNKMIHVYDNDNMIVCIIDKKGNFFIVKQKNAKEVA